MALEILDAGKGKEKVKVDGETIAIIEGASQKFYEMLEDITAIEALKKAFGAGYKFQGIKKVRIGKTKFAEQEHIITNLPELLDYLKGVQQK